jgi:hypothetical protein
VFQALLSLKVKKKKRKESTNEELKYSGIPGRVDTSV